jgi:hypothetical protein
MTEHQPHAEVRRSARAHVRKADDDLRIATLQTQDVIEAYFAMSPSDDGDFALDKFLKLQHQAMDKMAKYVATYPSFTKSVLESALPNKGRVIKFDNQPQHG